MSIPSRRTSAVAFIGSICAWYTWSLRYSRLTVRAAPAIAFDGSPFDFHSTPTRFGSRPSPR